MRRMLVLGPHLRVLVRPALGLMPIVIFLGLLAAALEGAGIGLIMPMLSTMTGAGVGGRHLAGFFQGIGAGMEPQARFLLLAGGVLALVILKNVVSGTNGVLSAWLYGRASHAIRSGLAARVTEVGYPFFGQQPPGRLLNVLSTESWRASDAIGTQVIIAINAAATAILFVFLCLLSWRMTLAVALGLSIIQLLQAAASAPLRGKSRDVSARNARLAAQMLHLIDGARVIRFFGQARLEQAAFDERSEVVRRELFRLESRRALIPGLMEALYSVLFVIIILIAWRSQIALTEIAAFLVLLYRMQPNVRNMQSAYAQLQSLSGSVEAVEWLLDPDGKPEQASGPEPALAPRHAIRFQDVSFTFPADADRAPVLDHATFELRAGRATALVGRSGAGKTTVINLLCRFLEPDSGAIWIDGRPLAALDTESWRLRLALASQDLDLFEGPIRDNIAYSGSKATQQQIEEAARMADAHDFILSLPSGYDTPVGHRGAQLSAGQRQRVALARALLRDPDVLILDEATNAMDGISERSIIETLRSRAGRRTTLVISHHRKTLGFCDDVLVLSDGKVNAGALSAASEEDVDAVYQRQAAPPAA